MAEEPLQRNAADADQGRRAERLARRREKRRREAYAAVLTTTTGRIVFLDLLESAGLYDSGFSESALLMAARIGAREKGLELLALLTGVDEAAVELMYREGRDRRRNDAKENAAGHTAAATEDETTS